MQRQLRVYRLLERFEAHCDGVIDKSVLQWTRNRPETIGGRSSQKPGAGVPCFTPRPTSPRMRCNVVNNLHNSCHGRRRGGCVLEGKNSFAIPRAPPPCRSAVPETSHWRVVRLGPRRPRSLSSCLPRILNGRRTAAKRNWMATWITSNGENMWIVEGGGTEFQERGR